MRISDWSSDVCSSDLARALRRTRRGGRAAETCQPDPARRRSALARRTIRHHRPARPPGAAAARRRTAGQAARIRTRRRRQDGAARAAASAARALRHPRAWPNKRLPGVPDLPVDEGALGAERRAARIAEYAVEVAALGRKLRLGIEDVVGAQRERPAITVVINGRVEDPFGRVDVVVELAGRTEFGHAPVAQGGAGEFPVVLLVCIGPDELCTGRSAERGVGKECVSKGSPRWMPSHKKTKNTYITP